MIYHGDLFDVLPTLEAESIDACVTDPPYGLGFMGKQWDTFKPEVAATKQGLRQIDKSPRWRAGDRRHINPNLKGRTVEGVISSSQIEYDRSLEGQRQFQTWTERWAREVWRVLKPGAYLLVCGAPRSYHRMASGLEDAGFEIRDCFCWLFGQGFPKSLNVGDGRGTALKPAYEPIVLARKPFNGTLKANLEKHGTGVINIDACRISTNDDLNGGTYSGRLRDPDNKRCLDGGPLRNGIGDFKQPPGRWPANVLLDEIAAEMLDEQSGDLSSPWIGNANGVGAKGGQFFGGGEQRDIDKPEYADRGGASRFFYVAKPSRAERDAGIYDLPAREAHWRQNGLIEDRTWIDRKDGKGPVKVAARLQPRRNHHPTVKPIELMRWLVKLVTPPSGTVLDPFAGSGTTGMACAYEFREFIGIEREVEYVEIAKRRIAACAPLFTESQA